MEGIQFIDENGKTSIPSITETEIIGPTVSLYIPGKENMITPERYVFKPYCFFVKLMRFPDIIMGKLEIILNKYSKSDRIHLKLCRI